MLYAIGFILACLMLLIIIVGKNTGNDDDGEGEYVEKKINSHGLKYCTKLFVHTSKRVAFIDENGKKHWLMYVGIDHDNYHRGIRCYYPKYAKNFYSFINNDLEKVIESYRTIEDVIVYNKEVYNKFLLAKNEFNEKVREYESKKNKY